MSASDLSKRKEEIEALVVAAQDGDHGAFAKLYDIFIDPIYRYIFYRVKYDDAEDLTETVFLKVWENLHRYKSDEKSSFAAWIFRISHNLVVDYYRGRKDKEFVELLDVIPDDKREHNPIKTTERTLQQETLKEALSKLKKTYQDIIVYKFINGFSNKEIARLMKRSEGSIRILQFRALKAIKNELKEMGVDYQF